MNYDPLQFDYEPLQGQNLCSIMGSEPLKCDDGRVSFDEIRFFLSSYSIAITIDLDKDELIVRKYENKNDTSFDISKYIVVEIFDEYRNKELGWCWVGRNWLGYSDVFLLSVAGIEPQMMICGMASKLHLYRIGH